MTTYEKSLNVLEELFAKDYQFALATSNDNIPSVRIWYLNNWFINPQFKVK